MDHIIRVHVTSRRHLYDPRDIDINVPSENPPVPIKFIDCMRTTRTDIDSMAEGQIEDVWGVNSKEEDELTESWTGRTIFTILKPRPAKRTDEWISGRLTRRTENSTRTPRIWPEVWHSWGVCQTKGRVGRLEDRRS